MMAGVSIGIDLGYSSSKTGFAAVEDGVLIKSFARHLKGAFVDERLQYFRDMIGAEIRSLTHKGHDIRMLIWEEPYAGMRNALRALSRLEGILYVVCADLLIPHLPVNNSTLKSALVPKIGTVKYSMRSAAKLLSGKEFDEDDQDEADAVLCAYYGEGVEG